MTKAAEVLFMTQSGVSQNIKNLEDFIGVQLFDRIKQRPIPTEKGRQLYEVTKKMLGDLEHVLLEITGKERSFTGPVNIGLPLEFGNNIILPLLAKIGHEHSGLHFHIKYGHAGEMNQLLLKGDLDFAFVDEFNIDRQITTESIASETLVLCCSKYYQNQLKEKFSHTAKFYEKLDYVDYVEGAPVLKMWFRHHLGQEIPLKVRASLMDVQGMSRVISEGLGLGILPLHVVERFARLGNDLFAFKGRGQPLTNTISLAYLDERSFSQGVLGVRNFLKESLKAN
jgi:DNA-binding transcriptional LysR family regulator